MYIDSTLICILILHSNFLVIQFCVRPCLFNESMVVSSGCVQLASIFMTFVCVCLCVCVCVCGGMVLHVCVCQSASHFIQSY